MPRSAEDLHRMAVDRVNKGLYSDARRRLAQAAALTEDPDLLGRIAGTQAYALARTGDLARAISVCRAAMDDSRLGAHTLAVLAGQMGALAEQAGDLDDAERWLTRGVDGLDGDAEARANLLMNRSLINMRRRALTGATRDVAQARGIFAALEMPIAEAQARHNEGYIALLSGDLVTANQSMLTARATLAPTSAVIAAICDLDRAEVLRDAGLTNEAEDSLRRVASTFGRHRMPQSRAEAEFQLACSLLTHDPSGARATARIAAARFRTLGNETWAARADGVRLRADLIGDARERGGGQGPRPRRAPSTGAVEAVASRLAERGFGNEAAAVRMSRILAESRRAPEADRTPIRVPPSASMEVRLLAYEARAARAAASGRPALARRNAAAGLDVLARWQESFGSLDLQSAITMHGSGLIYAGLESAVRSGRPDVVFEWSERARHLSQQIVPLRPSPDPAVAEDMAEIRMLRADDPAWLSNPRVAELRDRARERQWSATGTAAVEHRADLEEIRDSLDAETALIAFVYTQDALSALVVTPERSRLHPIPRWADVRRSFRGLRADLDMAASVRGPMGEIVRRGLADRLALLSDGLLADLVALTSARRLVITVPGVLSDVPWAMLPAMRGRVFTLAGSATRWARGRRTPRAASTAGFAAGPRVPRAVEEIDAAAGAWRTPTVLRGEDASVAGVTRVASRVDVLHVAAHGRHSVDNPMFSGLELADGTLFGYDIDLVEKVPDVVVLSACEVGRSSVRWGEEAVGMTRVWLYAGVRSVVAAPVIVADDDACDLLAAMHEGLAAGQAPSEALAAASVRTGIVAPFQVHGAGF
ncbi:CHAT domain-containing protein [Microbacterium sp. NPDC056044]|uniref:CHAT domain-containing protein n=1 Tax=Microbacterium sp. NPDC056044 TaxID=3345690 RepID=UPI0035E092C3